MNIFPVTYIISAYTNSRILIANRKAHVALKEILVNSGLGVKEVYGFYKGQAEKSLVVVGGNDKDMLDLAGIYSQESILKLHNDRYAELLYTTGQVEPLGQFVAVSEREALKHNAYTLDQTTNTYYIVR